MTRWCWGVKPTRAAMAVMATGEESAFESLFEALFNAACKECFKAIGHLFLRPWQLSSVKCEFQLFEVRRVKH